MAWIEQTGRHSWRVRYRRPVGTYATIASSLTNPAHTTTPRDLETDQRCGTWIDPATLKGRAAGLRTALLGDCGRHRRRLGRGVRCAGRRNFHAVRDRPPQPRRRQTNCHLRAGQTTSARQETQTRTSKQVGGQRPTVRVDMDGAQVAVADYRPD
jgi:hypothetical protein